MQKVMEFLEELAKNNNRDWFQQHRAWYEESREKFLFVTDVLIHEIMKFDPEILPLEPKDCMFRIFRDVRFSKDKRPYKTNFGSYIAKGGRKSSFAGYYIHLDPFESFVGGGLYMPPSAPLKAIRSYIAENGEALEEILRQPLFKKVYPHLMDDRLKTAPKGYDVNHRFIGLLRYKSFAVTHKLNKKEFFSERFIENTVLNLKCLQPFVQYLNNGIEKNM
ncbi:MAG: TIGR02453 family protein [Draconibacterium sp.]|nr:MAG: TIGR02453 family protein [Draconibacterium sp.]